jgi:hypothetical protein
MAALFHASAGSRQAGERRCRHRLHVRLERGMDNRRERGVVVGGDARTVLRRELYAIPALLGAAVVVVADEAGSTSPVCPLLGAALCFAIRMVGLRRRIDVPTAPAGRRAEAPPD